MISSTIYSFLEPIVFYLAISTKKGYIINYPYQPGQGLLLLLLHHVVGNRVQPRTQTLVAHLERTDIRTTFPNLLCVPVQSRC